MGRRRGLVGRSCSCSACSLLPTAHPAWAPASSPLTGGPLASPCSLLPVEAAMRLPTGKEVPDETGKQGSGTQSRGLAAGPSSLSRHLPLLPCPLHLTTAVFWLQGL